MAYLLFLDKKASNKITPAVKITGTLPSKTSTTLSSTTVPSRPHNKQCISSSSTNESPVPMALPLILPSTKKQVSALSNDSLMSLALPIPPSTIEEEVSALMFDGDLTDFDFPLDMMEFPSEDEDIDLGAFLSDVTEWL